ncbi:MAG: undecaprenyl-diphosphate phosphatase [Atribacterota bacterium]|nr:undecaprenyl-diphosphate phosphatase [Atribacterota bacterium]MDD4895423.1 undecaprenyl-diphosphate phosphatase [Atribacterota bacterium]MDD5636269.1 undecaprenyl-diphosphate phosphatase [Atribacterota bacterium]
MHYVILGLIQGLTEFLPVSSSGHLVISQNLLGISVPGVAFEVFVHFGTSLAVICLFKKEIKEIIISFLKSILMLFNWPLFFSYIKEDDHCKFAWLLFISTIPGAIIGYLLQNAIEKMFDNSLFTAFMLMITGLCLFFTDKYFIQGTKTIKDVNWVDAILIGLAQTFAIIPGISRSGFTIMMGLSRRLERNFAAKYSFILSIPIIMGASIYKFREIFQLNMDIFVVLISGLAAFLSGYLAMLFFTKMLINFKLRFFSYYLWIVAIIVVFLIIKSW